MRFKIVNKKVFAAFVLVVIIVVASLLYGIYYLTNEIIKIKSVSRTEKEIKDEIKQNIENQTQQVNQQEKQVNDIENRKDDAEQKTNFVVAYENQTYRYGVQFPEAWKMNNDFSEAKIEKTNNEKNLSSGGQTFWSNYDDINKYNAKNKPDDFRLLSLIVYQDDSKSVSDFAEKMGIKEISEERELSGKNVSGFEYIAAGVDEKNPNITAIFQKDKLFYVFKPVFMNGDENSAQVMEGIVKSFSIL
ncbi:MAG: hypothetical protein ACD_5C00006G0002 [uncultured bacterium]|nr:MAG: hypothetical protein ACD_5C00006G0002 [uncultured bacterium]